MPRYLLILVIIASFVLWVLKKSSEANKLRKLITEDIVAALREEYLESHKNTQSWLERLHQIRERYGDKISRRVAHDLNQNLREE